MTRAVALVLAGIFFLGACGDDSNTMDDEAAAWLQAEVRAARDAAAAADYGAALAALDRVNAATLQFRADDALSADRAARIAEEVEATRSALAELTTATTVATTTPSTAAEDDENEDDEGNGHGNGHGKDKKDD